MSETMRPISFANLMERALCEYQESGTIFGVHELYHHTAGKSLPIFHEKIETPFGPAAGPHTQLAQNIVAAYAGGSRFFEVKTVQKMDGEELAKCIARPCINADDEGYNVEWSTELTVPQAFDEYVKAWFAMKLLSVELGLGAPDGFVINMSVGYDLAGIKTEKIDRYLSGMRNAESSEVWKECRAWTLSNLERFTKINAAFVDAISPKVCDSITISTLHGCPPDEIERIATYLMDEKGLNTYIKCNPTLLGYEFARKTMDEMGYDYLVFDDHHFRDDLQYMDAVPMLQRLLKLAAKKQVEFGVKLTNTFPVTIAHGELPGEEMYMSGKSLYPLSIALAAKLEKDFDGKLRVSYSGGADYFNIGEIFACGVWPITMATTILKTGGYNRLKQIAELLVKAPYAPFEGVDVEKLSKLAESARKDAHHVKPAKLPENRKLTNQSPLLDCFIAGCEETCPIHQDIPAYLRLVGEGRYEEALRVICEKNPLPFMTGTICSHRCQSACTRNFYEESIHIRDMKLKAAREGFAAYLPTVKPVQSENPLQLAVIGGGPGGMAAAFLAARAGARVTLYEKRESLGGVVRHVIPAFRIPDEAIDNDEKLLKAVGVTIKLNTEVKSREELSAFDQVVVAVGAWKHSALRLENGEAMNVIDFLEQAKKAPNALGIKGHVVVVGGGNTAMDAARAAKRLAGVQSVSIVYRRQVRQMPADLEELELAVAEGVEFKELLAPKAQENGKLICEVMKLGAPGPDGRRSPEPTGERVEVPADTVIAAIGEKPDRDAISAFGENAHVIGDAKRGPATIVEAIADATAVVEQIMNVKPADTPMNGEKAELKARRGELKHACGDCDSGRCLGCATVCESCVDVCPNRANVVIAVQGKEQILHVDRLCNECGNCAAFCPYGGEPYHDKLTLFSTPEDFEASIHNQGFLPLGDGKLRVRLDGKVFETDGKELDKGIADFIGEVIHHHRYLL
ncbi:MAG: putative selenate reductase subunit YgfK [Eubacteriales bacterium]|nr:putative selenate reductase subunit YgfK [Eubacteriales bacterium]